MIIYNGKEIDLKSPEHENFTNEVLELFTDEIKLGNNKIKKALTISYAPDRVVPDSVSGAKSRGGVQKPPSFMLLLNAFDDDGNSWRYAKSKVRTSIPGGRGQDGEGNDYKGEHLEITQLETLIMEKDIDAILVAYKLGYLAPSLEDITSKSAFYIMNKKKVKHDSIDKESVLAEMTLAVNNMAFDKLKNIAMTMQIPNVSRIVDAIDMKITVKNWLKTDEKSNVNKAAYPSAKKIKDFMQRANEKMVTKGLQNEDELSKAIAFLRDSKLIIFYFKDSKIFYKKTEDGQKELICSYNKGQDASAVLMEFLAMNPAWQEKIVSTYNLYLAEV